MLDIQTGGDWLGAADSRQQTADSSWVAYLETEAMWSVKVSWSSIMTPRFLADNDKESILILMLWWMT